MPAFADLLPTVRMFVRPIRWFLERWGPRVLKVLGAISVLLLALACTRVPFDVHRWLGSGAGECRTAPSVIVVLGGSGMPSGPELLRLHRAAGIAEAYPRVPVFIIHPDSSSTMHQMADELILRGVAPERINRLSRGENTREQALLFAQLGRVEQGGVALVTAPENMYRSVLAFRKAGLVNTCAAPAWEQAMDHAFVYRHKGIGGKAWAPDVSENTDLRYTFWNYLKLEITCLRELVAIAYYRLNNWI